MKFCLWRYFIDQNVKYLFSWNTWREKSDILVVMAPAPRHRWIYCIRSNLFPAFNLQHFLLLPQTPGLRPQSRQQARNEIGMKENAPVTFLLHCRLSCSFIFQSVWLRAGCVTNETELKGKWYKPTLNCFSLKEGKGAPSSWCNADQLASPSVLTMDVNYTPAVQLGIHGWKAVG